MADVGVLRLDDWQAIRELAKQGLTIRAIVRTTGFSRNTVKKHLRGAPPVGRDAHTIRREFLELMDRDLAKQLAYFAEALHGDCFYQGKCPTEQGMRVAQDEAAQFIRRLRAN